MQLSIENEVLKKYPQAEIGYLVANVKVVPQDPFIESLKGGLLADLHSRGINATNFAVHPLLAVWRKIYKEDFRVKESTYRSSVEALVKRVITGKGMWNICNIVDLYNCCSLSSLLPMGGYDLDKIAGNVAIRYAREGETFLGIGERKKIEVEKHHVVYADDQRLICWLWNHKDSAYTSIDSDTKRVLFFVDSAGAVSGSNSNSSMVAEALQKLSDHLCTVGGVVLQSGILSQNAPSASLI